MKAQVLFMHSISDDKYVLLPSSKNSYVILNTMPGKTRMKNLAYVFTYLSGHKSKFKSFEKQTPFVFEMTFSFKNDKI